MQTTHEQRHWFIVTAVDAGSFRKKIAVLVIKECTRHPLIMLTFFEANWSPTSFRRKGFRHTFGSLLVNTSFTATLHKLRKVEQVYILPYGVAAR